MIVLLFTIIIILFIIINFKIYKNIINYLNIFLLIYYLAILLSSTGLYGFKIPSNTTYIYLILAITALEFFSIIFMLIKMPIKENKQKEILNKKVMTIIVLLIACLMFPMTIEAIQILKTMGFTGVRLATLSGNGYDSYINIVFTYLLIPLNKVMFIYALLEYIRNRKAKFPLILSLINVLQSILIFGGRSVIVDIILLTIIIIYEKYNRKIKDILKKNKKVIIALILAFFIIFTVTNERSLNREEGFIFNIYSYYVGSIHLFNVHIEQPKVSLLDGEHLLYGKAMLSPVWEIPKLFLNIVGVNANIETGIEIVNEQVQQFFTVKNRCKNE